jgi:hypothetical protein
MSALSDRALWLEQRCPECRAAPGAKCRRWSRGQRIGGGQLVAAAYLPVARGWLDRPCPSCKAEAGEQCLTPAGRTASRLHTARLRPARDEIGQDWRSAENLITRTLGPAVDRDVAVRDCAIEHETIWTSPAVTDPLTVFERNGRFAGYTYGAPVNQIGLVRGPGAVLETARGLTIGQTIAQATRLYGRLPTTARHGVGTWSTSGPGSPLSGLVLPTIYPLRRVTGSNPIATIGAGDIGCTNAS